MDEIGKAADALDCLCGEDGGWGTPIHAAAMYEAACKYVAAVAVAEGVEEPIIGPSDVGNVYYLLGVDGEQ